MEKCKNYKKYKGIKPPKCNNGRPCNACFDKWMANENKKFFAALDEVLERSKKRMEQIEKMMGEE